MAKHRTVILALLTLGSLAVVGALAGLSISGAFGGDGAPSDVSRPTSDATAPTPAPAPAGDTIVEPDPDFERQLNIARLSTRGWSKTDFSRHTVPYDEIIRVLGPNGIPSVDFPRFVTPSSAAAWLGGQEPVVSFELNGDPRAYPIQILTWHEIVNDVVGGAPVSVTFCPLCNSAIVFDRTLDGVVYDFGVSGNLRNSDLIMFDRQTLSWWQQLTGEGIVGRMAGQKLRFLPASITSFADFRAAYPNGKVLSRETGFRRAYGQNPYAGYDRADNPPFLFKGDTDGRLLPKERVVAVTIGDVDAAFPLSILEKEQVVNYTVNGQDLVTFFKSGTTSALDRYSIEESRDVGSTGVFDVHLDGRKLTFRAEAGGFVDNETGSLWNILGQAVAGPLSGKRLTPVLHGDHFWFAWGAFKPDTIMYQGVG